MTKLEEAGLSRLASKTLSLNDVLKSSKFFDGNIFAKWSGQATSTPKTKSGKSDMTDVTGWLQSEPVLSFSLVGITI